MKKVVSKMKVVISVLIILWVVQISWYLMHNLYAIGVNVTDSLPHTVFWIKKGALPTTQDKYLVFKKEGNKRYGNSSFVKCIGGRANDLIIESNNEYFINGNYLGTAKAFSKDGEPTEKTLPGIIPKGHYFVYSLHKDSYDSKYKEVGLIAASDVIGVAYPIF